MNDGWIGFLIITVGIVGATFLAKCAMQSGKEAQALHLRQQQICMPFAVLTSYDRGERSFVVCAQEDGGVVEKEVK